jgi:outer membrane lipoprotein SlyB
LDKKMYFFVGATLSPRATTVVGEFVGWLVGEFVGWLVGECVGWLVGEFVGCLVGEFVGWGRVRRLASG